MTLPLLNLDNRRCDSSSTYGFAVFAVRRRLISLSRDVKTYSDRPSLGAVQLIPRGIPRVWPSNRFRSMEHSCEPELIMPAVANLISKSKNIKAADWKVTLLCKRILGQLQSAPLFRCNCLFEASPVVKAIEISYVL